ncbi:MAG TPA: flagellar hook protein FlgE [Vicinamibacterales bacterium]|nr:flagellar hook protein FlgE [Vicinamibacterales bacterium]
MALGSFSAGLSGLNANSQALTVIGNNLANINTVAFKASAVNFADLVSQNVGGTSENPTQIGLGVGLASISPVFSQGAIESTASPTNVAIQGNGFFVLNGSNGTSYTRAGDFSLDSSGTLVTPDGQFVQGYTTIDPITGKVSTAGTPTNITVPPGVLHSPTATTQFSTTANLDAGAAKNDTFATSIQVFDSLGAPHVMTMTYTNTGPGAWNYSLTAEGAEVAGGVAGTPSVIGNGTLTFDQNGALKTVNGAAPANVLFNTPAWADGADVSKLNWGLVGTSGTATLTNFAAPSATSSVDQNGSAAGQMQNISINSDGEIVASFGAGQTVAVGQLALANFNNPEGLVKLGSNEFGQSQSAGLPNVGIAGTGGRGSLTGSALEQSNVDIATEFTQMILAQRGYQANAKTITVSDQLLVDTLNLKQ